MIETKQGIILDDNYWIEQDSYNCILKYKKVLKEINSKGNFVISKERWYYNNIQQCLRKYLAETLKSCESIDLVLSRIDEVEQTIKNLEV